MEIIGDVAIALAVLYGALQLKKANKIAVFKIAMKLESDMRNSDWPQEKKDEYEKWYLDQLRKLH